MSLENTKRKLSWKELFGVVKLTFVEFFQEQSFFHGAALAYYTIFAMVPMFYLAVLSFGKIVGQDTILKMIEELLHEQVGLQDSTGLMDFLKNVSFDKGSVVLNIIGIFALLLSSSALLSSLRTSINEFYDVHVVIANKRKRFEHLIGTKLLSMVMLPVFGVVMLVMYFGETFLLSISTTVFGDLDSVELFLLGSVLNIFTIVMNMLLFTIIFKYVHDGYVEWNLALKGGLVTSLLLFSGQLLINYYLKNYFFGSKAGVAGTLLVLLAWMYYTSQIIFLGAKFTKVYADTIGKSIAFRGRKISTKRFVERISKNRK